MEFNSIGFFSIGAGIVIFLFDLFSKRQMKKIVEEGFESKGEVIDYENKTVRVAGTWTSLDYPIVEYIDTDEQKKIGFIKYAKNSGRYFSIGQEVPIIIHDGTIYYKHALANAYFRPLAIILIIIGLGYELFK